MTKMSTIDRGQPVEICQTGELPADKWALLDALTHARATFGLSHRTLGVLRALMTFFPDRVLPRQCGAGVVYPSNRVLSDRLNGMPESTLRRHLSTLVKSGLIERQDSANRKRFAKFGGVAFGFDLSPLARAWARIAELAHDARIEEQRCDALRARLAAARQRAMDCGLVAETDPLMEDIRLGLRRRLTSHALEQLLCALLARMDEPETAELSGSSSQNERHIQTTDKSDSVSLEPCGQDVELKEVVATCSEYKAFFPETRPDWQGLESVAERSYGMLGITPEVYFSAKSTMGQRQAAVTVLCLMEAAHKIRKPGAYLRALIQRAESGTFNLSGLLQGVGRARVVS